MSKNELNPLNVRRIEIEKIEKRNLSFCHKLKCSINPYIFATGWCKLFKFQTRLFEWHNLKFYISKVMKLDCKDIRIGKSEFVAKAQFLIYWFLHDWFKSLYYGRIIGSFKLCNTSPPLHSRTCGRPVLVCALWTKKKLNSVLSV